MYKIYNKKNDCQQEKLKKDNKNSFFINRLRLSYKAKQFLTNHNIDTKRLHAKTINLMLTLTAFLYDNPEEITMSQVQKRYMKKLDLYLLKNSTTFEEKIFKSTHGFEMTGKQIKDNVEHLIETLKERGIIIKIGNTIERGDYTKSLTLANIKFTFKSKKRNLKKPYNPKTASPTSTKENISNVEPLLDIPLKKRRNYNTIQQTGNSIYEKIYINSSDLRKINSIILDILHDRWTELRKQWTEDERYKYIIKSFGNYKILIRKARHLQPINKQICKGLQALYKPSYLLSTDDKKIASNIKILAQLMEYLEAEVKKLRLRRKPQQKMYQDFNIANQDHYFKVLQDMDGNVTYTINKLIGLKNEEERQKFEKFFEHEIKLQNDRASRDKSRKPYTKTKIKAQRFLGIQKINRPENIEIVGFAKMIQADNDNDNKVEVKPEPIVEDPIRISIVKLDAKLFGLFTQGQNIDSDIKKQAIAFSKEHKLIKTETIAKLLEYFQSKQKTKYTTKIIDFLVKP